MSFATTYAMLKWILLTSLAIALTAHADDVVRRDECRKTATVAVCDLKVPSANPAMNIVPVRAWIPHILTSETDVIVFLHGRGYAKAAGEGPTMLEALDFERYVLMDRYKERPFIMLAPQDIFVQSDSNERGQDYWIGADGRDWSHFLGVELPEYLRKRLGLHDQLWKIMGISMGAHGAMRVALEHGSTYDAFAALSPVFRATYSEIPANDRDVFMRNGKIAKNLGADLLHSRIAFETLPPHQIMIHHEDFALQLPSANTVWRKLETNANAEITTESSPGGHSADYWRLKLPLMLQFLSTQY
jgi:S-formylglutathione hydrolase FrmB